MTYKYSYYHLKTVLLRSSFLPDFIKKEIPFFATVSLEWGYCIEPVDMNYCPASEVPFFGSFFS